MHPKTLKSLNNGVCLMSNIFEGSLASLTEAQLEFICNEFEVTKDELFSESEYSIGEMYNALCEIETAEIPVSSDEEESERCKIVSSIVTVLGNAIAESNGYFDEEDD